MIDKLELLLALARERHFGRAAEASGVTQPTLSSTVKSLEDQFGILIVERGSRFRGFTPEGERVLEWARRLVGDSRTMRQEIEALKHGLTGHLRLGVIPTALPFLPAVSIPFGEKFPAVRLTVLSLTSATILDRLADLELDIGISYVDDEPIDRCVAITLYEEQYTVLVSPESAHAKAEAMTWSEAAKLPLCLLTPDMQNRRIVDRHLAEAGGRQALALESNSMLTLYAHVRTGKFASIISTRLAETLDPRGRLKAIPLTEPSVKHKIGLLILRREPHSPLVNAFVSEARRAAAVQLQSA
jgi:DNA-binding transcriptional LysR family regulator